MRRKEKKSVLVSRGVKSVYKLMLNMNILVLVDCITTFSMSDPVAALTNLQLCPYFKILSSKVCATKVIYHYERSTLNLYVMYTRSCLDCSRHILTYQLLVIFRGRKLIYMIIFVLELKT